MIPLTYPGVYLGELPSGNRTITGASTSLTVFVGFAARGDVDVPVTINSFADFERTFGGLWLNSYLGFAVKDFYSNGGSQAIIIRVLHNQAAKAKADLLTGLSIEANNEGAWGNKLEISASIYVDPNDPNAKAIVASYNLAGPYNLATTDLLNLTVKDTATQVIEQFNNITIKDSPRRIDAVLENESNLVRISGNLPTPAPVPAAVPSKPLTGGSDGVAGIPPGGTPPDPDDVKITGQQSKKSGIYALDNIDAFNILYIPPYNNTGDIANTVINEAASYCVKRDAILILDAPSAWTDKDKAKDPGVKSLVGVVSSPYMKNVAVYFPRIQRPNPFHDNQIEKFGTGGMVAGTLARIDGQRGIWKTPAGLEAGLSGITALNTQLTDAENGELNILGINCIRNMPAVGPVIWGGRTLEGNDLLASEWKYLSVRRMMLYLKQSLYRGTQWVVFEPNDEPLWQQIRLTVGSFMDVLFRQGAFQGQTANKAYFVKCDKETTTQNDIDQGVVNILVGFAPLKPAEFVVVQIQQIAGQKA